MASVETIHRTTIFYEADPDLVEAIQNRAFDLAGNLEVETMHGNACCSPHIIAEGSSIREVREWAEKVERYIRRRKGAELLEAA